MIRSCTIPFQPPCSSWSPASASWCSLPLKAAAATCLQACPAACLALSDFPIAAQLPAWKRSGASLGQQPWNLVLALLLLLIGSCKVLQCGLPVCETATKQSDHTAAWMLDAAALNTGCLQSCCHSRGHPSSASALNTPQHCAAVLTLHHAASMTHPAGIHFTACAAFSATL